MTPFELSADEVDAIRDVQSKLYNQAVKMGWYDTPREVGTQIALIHSEVSEALEAVRKNLMDDHLTHRMGVEVELADAVIRILDLGGRLGLDIAGAMAEKHVYNYSRADHQKENREKVGGKAF